MIESVFVVLLVSALWLSKTVLFGNSDPFDRTVSSVVAMVLYGTLSFSAFGVQAGNDLETVSMEPVAWLCFTAAALMLTTGLFYGTESLKDMKDEQMTNYE